MAHITLIGTGHVFRIEDTVREAVLALRPDLVLVELDRARLQALMMKRDGKQLPVRGGFVQSRLQKFQEGVAGLYGGTVGAEMLAAVDGARQLGARVGLIDRPADVTVKRAMKALTWREKMRAVGMVISGAARSLVPSSRAKAQESVEAEIKRYQDDPAAALDELGSKFPSVKRVVIDERDTLMGHRVLAAAAQVERVVVVVGDGHIGGISAMLGDHDVQTFRLPAVRAGQLPKPSPLDASVAVNVQWDPPQSL